MHNVDYFAVVFARFLIRQPKGTDIEWESIAMVWES